MGRCVARIDFTKVSENEGYIKLPKLEAGIYYVTDTVGVLDTIFIQGYFREIFKTDYLNLELCIYESAAYSTTSTDTVHIEQKGDSLYANNTDCVRVDLTYTLGVTDESITKNHLKIYPNPTVYVF